MIHPDSELRPINDAIGLGVVATQPIPRGTVVWAIDELDQRVSPERVKELGTRYAKLLDRFAYLGAGGERVLCWDLARWVNHSCAPNVLSCGWDFDIAVRDIAAGEEITNDYGALNLERSFTCRCGLPGCRRTIRPSDFERLADGWDATVRDAFDDVARVPQPLWKWVAPRRAISAALRDPSRVPSIHRHRWTGQAPLGSAARVMVGSG
jgi:hypothetical protein